ncbi:MAG: winged helix-turn-helix transcriptional regulator [Nocardiopsaceae bacterium]|nr:winged helix-turn-helix transcriptional regulator [Nocardiopsaceae bacterium]
MTGRPPARLRAVHRALADPLRLQLFGLLTERPRSARELAELTGKQPNRLYHHLDLIEGGGLIEVVEYRQVPGGKVERVYAPVAAEPPGDVATPTETAEFLSAVLETTRAEITAAARAKEAGEDRTFGLVRGAVKVSQARLAELRALVEEFISSAEDQPDPDGTWTTIVWASADREQRPGPGVGNGGSDGSGSRAKS